MIINVKLASCVPLDLIFFESKLQSCSQSLPDLRRTFPGICHRPKGHSNFSRFPSCFDQDDESSSSVARFSGFVAKLMWPKALGSTKSRCVLPEVFRRREVVWSL